VEKQIIIFDKPYPAATLKEGLAVQWAVTSGACNSCCYLEACENSDTTWAFPEDAPCMVKMRANEEAYND